MRLRGGPPSKRWLVRKWETFLTVCAAMPFLCAYLWWREGRGLDPSVLDVALVAIWEAGVVWTWRRRRLFWGGPRY